MEPLPLKVRRFYSALFFVLFIGILPVVTLYASGYRLSGFGLVSTGGIFVAVPVSGVSISLNGEEVDRSSLFSKSFFFDNLVPGSYVVQANADGFYPWSKTLIVESQLVSDVSVLAITQPLNIYELVSEDSEEEVATSTTKFVSGERLLELATIFAATTSPMSTTTNAFGIERTIVDSTNGISLILEEGDLLVHFDRASQPPSSFCVRPSSCTDLFSLERGDETVTNAVFFAGGVLYRTKETGVYFTEVDIRQPRLVIPVFSAPKAEFKVINNTLTIESDGVYYEIAGF